MVLLVAETSTKVPVVNIKAITNSNPILDYQRQLYIKNKIEMNQTTNVHSLFRNRQGNPDSTIRECFVCGSRNTGKFLLVGSRIREIFAYGIRNTGKFLFVGSEIVALESLIPAQGIRNPANNWNTKFQFHWQKIRNQVPGIRNPQC